MLGENGCSLSPLWLAPKPKNLLGCKFFRDAIDVLLLRE